MNTVKKAPRSLAFAAALCAALAVTAPVVGYAADAMPGAVALDPIRIDNVSFERFDGGTRIFIDANAPLVYTSYSPQPSTLVIDMAATDGAALPADLAIGTSEVVGLSADTTGTEGQTSARITLQLNPAVQGVPYFESLGNRLVITVDKPASAAEVADAPAPTVASTEASEAQAPEVAATILERVAAMPQAGIVAIALQGDGPFAAYDDFVIENPDRLIVDLKGVLNKSLDESLVVNAGGVERIRVAQYQKVPEPVTRVVLDLSAKVPYRIEYAATGMSIVLGEESSASFSAAPEATVATVTEVSEQPLVELAPVVDAVDTMDSASVMEPKQDSILDLGDDVMLFETADAALPMEQDDAERGQIPISFETKTIGGGEQPYNGKPLSLDFKDADIKDIFRFISDFSGLNVVLDPSVAGKITIKLTEVPWDQALDIILKNNGLGMVFENNVIRIATTQKLATEEANRRRLAEEKELAVPLKTITRALSYAKAIDLQKILEKIMSKRGEVIVDKRTNTLILSDVPDKFDIISNLIDTLDAPTPQVQIETRIVETTRDFVHDLGIQWGFLGLSDAAHGNTTDLIFPNNARVDGTGVAAGGLTGPLGGYAVNLPSVETNSGIGLSFGNVLDTFRLDIALTAFEREGKGRVISAPKITTQNNVEAEIKSGKQIPVTTIANNTVTTIFVDALLSLKVTPQITAEGTVIMNIKVDKSQPDFANAVLGTPPIDKREATTSVLVRDGGTTVIGGIFQVTDQNGQSRTPFLHKIPILGNLFKNKSITRFNNELLIFVTPRIVKY